MACAFYAKVQSGLSNSNPVQMSVDCGAGANRLLVLSLIVKGAVDRTGGAPTYPPTITPLIQIGTPLKYATSPEQGVEMWYLPNPASGANTLWVPNTGGLYLRLIASSYTGAAQSSALDVYGDATGITANPSKLITTTGAGEAIVDVCGNGDTAVESGRSHTLLYANDEGTWNDAAQYTIQASGGDITFSHTMAADDWALRVASFKQYVAAGATSDPAIFIAARRMVERNTLLRM